MKATGLYDAAREKANEAVGNAVVKALNERGFKGAYVPTKEKALELVLSLIPEGASVGIPGTVTMRELGALEALEARGNTVYHHWGNLTPEEMRVARNAENAANVFLTSTNALTQDGELVNIDGAGNRVSGMAWGDNIAIFVAGINKVTSTLEEGIRRARAATIPNALRQNGETPCVQAGRCIDCRGPKRMCHALLILEAPVTGRETHVILVGENLGF